VEYRCTTVEDLIMAAYHVKRYQISGLTQSQDLYDVIATLPAGSSKDSVPGMLQKLLAERFHLTFHRESRVLRCYEMAVAPGGLKVSQEGPDAVERLAFVPIDNGGQMLGKLIGKTSSPKLAATLSLSLDRPVLDKTGLSGVYPINIDFDVASTGEGLFRTSESDAAVAASAPAPSLFVAIERKLGLKLVPAKGTFDIMVIDHVDRTPVAN
jgi:uncharacterized protein (TIGR03435 family)